MLHIIPFFTPKKQAFFTPKKQNPSLFLLLKKRREINRSAARILPPTTKMLSALIEREPFKKKEAPGLGGFVWLTLARG